MEQVVNKNIFTSNEYSEFVHGEANGHGETFQSTIYGYG